MVLTPFVGGGIAYGIASVLPRPDVPEAVSVPLLAGIVGTVVANLEFAFLSSVGGTLAAAGTAAVSADGTAVRPRSRSESAS